MIRRIVIVILFMIISQLAQIELSHSQVTGDSDKTGFNKKNKALTINETIDEVVVMAKGKGSFTEITENAQKLVDMAGALGDPLSAVYSLPGVVSRSYGASPAVRGSSPDDNLYIVDFMPASYIFHELHQSVYSEYILQDFQLHSSGFGPQFGGVTGAVFDITLRQPKRQKIGGALDLSFLRSGVFLEGGATKDSAFYLSARKSMVHLVLGDESDENISVKEPRQDEDYQFKYDWGKGDHYLSLSANGARDYFEATFSPKAEEVRSNPDFAGDAKIQKKHHGEQLVYTYSDSESLFFKAGIGVSSYGDLRAWGSRYFQNEERKTKTLKFQASKKLNDNHTIEIGGYYGANKQGIDYDKIVFNCTESSADCDLARLGRFNDKVTINIGESSAYIKDRWGLSDRAFIDLGLHWQKNDYSGESFIHPRLSLDFALTPEVQFIARYGRYNRLPKLDYILPKVGSPNLKSLLATHASVGVHARMSSSWSLAMDFYHKELSNLVLARNEIDLGTSTLYSNDVEGESYGVDILLNKDLTDKWYGWAALNIGKSVRRNKLSGREYDYYLDTPYNLNLVLNYRFSEQHNLGIRLNVRAGNAYTPIIGVQTNPDFQDAILPIYGAPFSERFSSYQRVDLRYKYDFSLFGNEASWIIDIINVLNKENPIERELDYTGLDYSDSNMLVSNSSDTEIIPTIGFRYKW